jgi:hypothetical protein
MLFLQNSCIMGKNTNIFGQLFCRNHNIGPRCLFYYQIFFGEIFSIPICQRILARRSDKDCRQKIQTVMNEIVILKGTKQLYIEKKGFRTVCWMLRKFVERILVNLQHKANIRRPSGVHSSCRRL